MNLSPHGIFLRAGKTLERVYISTFKYFLSGFFPFEAAFILILGFPLAATPTEVRDSELRFNDHTTLGGAAFFISKSPQKIQIHASGEYWVQLPLRIGKTGVFELRVESSPNKYWSVFIDGETYPDWARLQARSNHENLLPAPVILSRGNHSLILLSNSNGENISVQKITLMRFGKDLEKVVDTRRKWIDMKNGTRLLEIGRTFTGNSVNVNIARDMALFSRNGFQYVSYFDPEGHVVIARRELTREDYEKYWLPLSDEPFPECKNGKYALDDPHYFISMQMDGAGYIHLSFGNHNNALHYFKTKYPFDISVWEEPLPGMGLPAEGKKISYISFGRLPNGCLLGWFRVGLSGDGDEWLMKYDPSAKKWEALGMPLISGDHTSNPYLWRPIITPDGRIELAWTWRLSIFKGLPDSPYSKKDFGGFTNKDICFACSRDGGKTWERSDGTLYELPIQRLNKGPHSAEVIVSLPMGEDFFNHYGSDYDSKGRPHFTYSRRDNHSGGVPQQWHLYWDGARWINSVATDYRSRFAWTRNQQNGLASTYLARPSILATRNDRILLISRSHERNDKIEIFTSPSQKHQAWIRRIAFDGSAGGWEPQMDLDLWHRNERLQMFLAGITDRALMDKSVHWREKARLLMEKLSLFLIGLKLREKNDYYSSDSSVELLRPDPLLEENKGYLLEVPLLKN
jgi:hypothetical protein